MKRRFNLLPLLQRWKLPPLLWSGLLVILVAGPWIASGFLFAVDFPGPRRFPFPDSLTSSAPLEFALAGVGAILSAEFTAKLFIFLTLLVAAITAYRAVPGGGFIPRAIGSTVYVINPFVYGRLQYGHLFLLAGYAVLPWAASRLRVLLAHPSLTNTIVAAVGLVVLGTLDLHLLIPAALLTIVAFTTQAVANRRDLSSLMAKTWSLALTAGLALVGSAYWLIPLLAGSSVEGAVIGRTGQADLNAYSAVADPGLGLVPNLLGLYGFWAENTGRFLSMKDFVPLWPIALAAILALIGLGAAAATRAAPDGRLPDLRQWAIALLIAGVVATILEMGVSDPHTAPIVRWLDGVFPPYRGLRDAGKWGALVALIYSQLVPLGVIAVIAFVRRRPHAGASRVAAQALATGILLALPLYYGNGLLFGLHGQIQPSNYPAAWYAADHVLSSDPHPGRALFLPWHEYLSLSFVRNENRVVATPAASFFSIPIVASKDPEIPGIVPPDDPDQVAIDELVGAGGSGDWATTLAARGVKYVVLAREADWQEYGYIDQQLGLTRVADYGAIVVYRNTLIP